MRGTQTWPPASALPGPAATATAGLPIGDGPHSDGPERVGYARVSTRSQNDDTQIADLAKARVSRIFADHGVSGKLASRPELDRAVAYLRPGDTFVITRLSRAMRSLRHLLNLAHELAERGIGLLVLKQDIDTSSSTGRLLFHILSAIDEWQRELIVEGTLEGLEVAKAKGHTGGRPRAMTPEQEDLAMEMVTLGKPVAAVARTMNASRASVYRAAIRRGIIDPPEGDGKGRPPLPEETRAKVLRMLGKEESIIVTAEACGVSRTTVRRIWREAGHEEEPPGAGKKRSSGGGGRSPALTPEQERDAVRMLRDGETPATIAAVLKVHRASVYRALDRLEQEQEK